MSSPTYIQALVMCIFICTGTFAYTQNITVFGYTPTVLQTTPLSDKYNWNLFFSTTINPCNLKFDSLDYPASDIRLQLASNISFTKNSNCVIAAGVLYQRNFPFDKRFVNEFRPYQQTTIRHHIATINVSHRARLSERFIQNKNAGSYPLTLMFQYMTAFEFKLKSKNTSRQGFYLTGYTEEYLTISGSNKYKSFSEFWAYVGFGYHLGKWGKLQNGVVYEWVIRNAQQNTRRLLYIETFLLTNFALFKNKRDHDQLR